MCLGFEEKKASREKKGKVYGKVELCCYTHSFRSTYDVYTWFYILNTIYVQRQKASFVNCQHNKKRKCAGIKIYHNSKTGSSASLPGTILYAFPHGPVQLPALSCLQVTQILWTTLKKPTSTPNKCYKSLNVSSGLILVQFIAACLLLELIICSGTVLEVTSSPDWRQKSCSSGLWEDCFLCWDNSLMKNNTAKKLLPHSTRDNMQRICERRWVCVRVSAYKTYFQGLYKTLLNVYKTSRNMSLF